MTIVTMVRIYSNIMFFSISISHWSDWLWYCYLDNIVILIDNIVVFAILIMKLLYYQYVDQLDSNQAMLTMCNNVVFLNRQHHQAMWININQQLLCYKHIGMILWLILKYHVNSNIVINIDIISSQTVLNYYISPLLGHCWVCSGILRGMLTIHRSMCRISQPSARRWRTSCLAVWKWRIASPRPRPYVSWGTATGDVDEPWDEPKVGWTNCSNHNRMMIVTVMLIVGRLFGYPFSFSISSWCLLLTLPTRICLLCLEVGQTSQSF